MCELDFLTATPREVLTRSLILHPSLFAEGLAQVQRDHGKARELYRAAGPSPDAGACQTATRHHDAARKCIEWAQQLDASDAAQKMINAGAPYWRPALDVACRLQCVPVSLVADIAARAPARLAVL